LEPPTHSMMRDPKKLADNTFDLLIVGGGIYGAVLSWMASLTGFSVGIIDKGDFAQGTSANTMKIIHGGLRYIQQMDLPRIRQSLRERQRMMWLAPHLVHLLPCVTPVYDHGMQGKELMNAALLLYDMIGIDRNRLPDPSKYIPRGRMLSVLETNRLISPLPQQGLKGAAQWYDSLCFNTERLVLAFVKSASKFGAVAANYVMATKLIQRRDSVIGIQARDQLTGEKFEILAKNIVNCTGPWVNDLLRTLGLPSEPPEIKFASGINIIVKRLFPLPVAVGIKNRSAKHSQLYFVVPWRGKSIVGTEWFPYDVLRLN